MTMQNIQSPACASLADISCRKYSSNSQNLSKHTIHYLPLVENITAATYVL